MKYSFSTAVASLAIAFLLLASMLPTNAFADTETGDEHDHANSFVATRDDGSAAQKALVTTTKSVGETLQSKSREIHESLVQAEQRAQASRNKTLEYDPALIAAVGTQSSTGHTICCPGFACAYGDAIISGIANPHSTYGCGNCLWPGWGGGNSSFRSLGSDAALLKEAHDEILAGHPTVIHVSASYGEHWITLIGYQNAEDPEALSLDNFIALDPWDGSTLIAGDRFRLYGDHCEHVSSSGMPL